MKKLDSKKIMITVFLLSLAVFGAVYFLVFNKYNEKADTLEASNRTLNQRVIQLKEFYDNMEKNKQEMSDMQAQVIMWLNEFPADVKEEDVIVMALETEKNAIVAYKNINIGERQALRTIPADTVRLSGMENLTQDLIFVKRTTGYVHLTDYENMKSIIRTINESKQRVTISNATYSVDEETQLLNGTLDISFYSVVGDGKEYVPQRLKDYEAGLSNLFGTVENAEEFFTE